MPAAESNLDTTILMIDERAYETYGFGDTEQLARFNATRNALQFATRQLVISEIKIDADEIIEDVLYSSMNGYIERFDVLDSILVAGQHFVRARLQVDPVGIKETIKIFTDIGLGIENTGAIDTGGIRSALSSAQAEFDRRSNQLKVARKLYKEMLRDFPSKAYELELDKVEVDLSDEPAAIISGTIAFKPTWIKHYRSHYRIINNLLKWLPKEIFLQGSHGKDKYRMRELCYRDAKRHFCNRSPVFYSDRYDPTPASLRFLDSSQFVMDSRSRPFVVKDKTRTNYSLSEQFFIRDVPDSTFDDQNAGGDSLLQIVLCTYDTNLLYLGGERLRFDGKAASPSLTGGEFRASKFEVFNHIDQFRFRIPVKKVANVEDRRAPVFWQLDPSRSGCQKNLRDPQQEYIFEVR